MSTDAETLEGLSSDFANTETFCDSYFTAKNAFKAGWHAREQNPSAEASALALALTTLKNEVKGTLHAHRVVFGYDHGNSNWACLELALERSSEALAAFKARGV